MPIPEKFPALVVSKSNDERGDSSPSIHCELQRLGVDDLHDGDVVVRIVYSAINYKDGLASHGNPGVVRKFPLIPGIDAVGEVVSSADGRLSPGDQVMIAGAKFGTAHHGGFASFARVPADWVFVLPEGLSMIDAVTWGTAGFTAAQSVEKLVHHGVRPDAGDVLVTGATGGVGVFSVKLLSKLGYRVVASTGKKDKWQWLKDHGAADVVSREEVCDVSDTPLLKGRWAAAIDTVGGATLASVIRATEPHGCVTACGLVGGHELDLTVYPFILRGVTLCGIDSANITREARTVLWNKIADAWNIDVAGLRKEIEMSELVAELKKIMDGKIFGRTVVEMES